MAAAHPSHYLDPSGSEAAGRTITIVYRFGGAGFTLLFSALRPPAGGAGLPPGRPGRFPRWRPLNGAGDAPEARGLRGAPASGKNQQRCKSGLTVLR